MAKTWPADVIRELLALAKACGEARAELSSPEDAKNFRFAIYSFRRANDLGENLTITLSGNEVIVRHAPTPKVTIVSASAEGK